MIAAVGVSKKGILQTLSLEVRPGELLCAIGPNGAGKSTLVKLLSGEWPPTEGTIKLNGRPFRDWKPRDRAARLAVLPQQSTLAADFTALEIVMMGRTPHGERPKDYQIAHEALAMVECSHLASRLYPELSGGEQQSVQFARVLAQVWHGYEPNLLLDEPIANLDPAQQHRILAIARDRAHRGAAVLAILHDLNLAGTYADRIAILKEGRLSAIGTPVDVLTEQAILDNFAFHAAVLSHPHRGVPLVVAR